MSHVLAPKLASGKCLKLAVKYVHEALFKNVKNQKISLCQAVRKATHQVCSRCPPATAPHVIFARIHCEAGVFAPLDSASFSSSTGSSKVTEMKRRTIIQVDGVT